jgi:signal transduction histidine kinase
MTDAAPALLLTAVGQLEVWTTRQAIASTSARQVVFAVAIGGATAAVAWWRRAPLPALVAASVCTASAGRAASNGDTVAALLASLVLLYAAASSLEFAPAAVGLAIAVGAAFSVGADAADWAFAAVLLGSAWAAGRTARRHRLLTQRLEDANEQLQREAGVREQLAVAEERARIAREIHDVLAHTISVMVVQAEAAEELLGRDPSRAERALTAIQRTGREAIGEMRGLLGMLRSDGRDEGLGPQPGLDRLPELVAELQRAGLQAELTVEGERRRLSPGIELCTYRVVQEALTNTLKHSTASTATVTLAFGPTALDVAVLDDGAPANGNGDARRNGYGTGHGLLGLRERVGMYGGSIRIGARRSGGFEVSCSIPYQEAAR